MAAVALVVLTAALVARQSSGMLVVAVLVTCAPLVVLALSLASVETLIVALVATTQIQISRVPLLGYSVLPEHLLLAAIVVAMVVRFPSVIFRRPKAYEALLAAWIGWNAVTTYLYAPDKVTSWAIVIWLILAWLILWIVGGALRMRAASVERVMRAGLWLAGALGLVTGALWIMALLGGPQIQMQPEFLTGTVAAKGASLEANLFGAQELLWLFWLVRDRIVSDRRAPSWQAVGVLFGVVASMTRAVWLAAIILVVVAVFAWSRKVATRSSAAASSGGQGRGRGTVLVWCATGLMLTAAFVTPAGQKFNESLNFKSTTGAGRVTDWKAALHDLGDSHAFPVGLGTNSYGARHQSQTIKGERGYLGSLPMAILYDTGFVGLALYSAAMIAFILRTRDPVRRILNLALGLILLVVGAGTSPVWFGFVWVVFAGVDAESDRAPGGENYAPVEPLDELEEIPGLPGLLV